MNCLFCNHDLPFSQLNRNKCNHCSALNYKNSNGANFADFNINTDRLTIYSEKYRECYKIQFFLAILINDTEYELDFPIAIDKNDIKKSVQEIINRYKKLQAFQ